jgi:Domain of unknown function (DUF4160)
MYWNEGGHAAPHFHAHHAGTRASVDLDGRVVAGDLDGTALRYVQEWALTHRDELVANWERARRDEPILPIDPLA